MAFGREVMSSDRKLKGLALPELIGFIGPLVALVCIFTAIFMSPWFTWGGNALSDLGNYNNGVAAAVVFNAGLIVTGLLMMYVSVSLFKSLRDWPTRLALVALVVSLLFLIGIGVLCEIFGILHFYVSFGFFVSFPISMWILSLAWLRFRNLWWFCLVSVLLPFVSLYMWVTTYSGTQPWTGVAIPEMITSVTAIGWIWIIGLLHHKGLLNRIIKS
jgi:hypothetical membrane protein